MNNISIDSLTVISVTYNSKSILGDLSANLDFFSNVVLVDNASKDDTVEFLVEKFPNAKIVVNSTNLGFGSANNVGMRHVRTEFALLLNPDAKISLKSVQTLINTMHQYPQAGIVAPQGWEREGVPQLAYRQAFYEKRQKQVYKIPDATCSARWLHGCCLLVRADVYRSIGGFDENFFLYYEDDDLCLRTLAQGYDCLVEPKANVLHIGGASSTRSWKIDYLKGFHFFRSRRRIIGKYLGQKAALQYRTKIMVAAPFAIVLYALALQRKHLVKWLSWGCSAWTCSLLSK